METFSDEQKAAIRKVIDEEVARAVSAERENFAKFIDEMQAAMNAGREPPKWVAPLKGAAKSWQVWTGGLLVVMPELQPALQPLITEWLGADAWRRTVQILGIVMILLRARTTMSLSQKGESQ